MTTMHDAIRAIYVSDDFDSLSPELRKIVRHAFNAGWDEYRIHRIAAALNADPTDVTHCGIAEDDDAAIGALIGTSSLP